MARQKVSDLQRGPTPLGLRRIPAFSGTETVKEAALMWAESGAAVIPLRRGTKSPGSILGQGWQFQASNDPAQVEQWFSRTDVGGVAIECGRSGVVVVDVDQNVIGVDGGVVEHTRGLHDLRAHRYFQMPADKEIGNSKGGLEGFKGDIRGFGGCVVVYPTPHPDGGQYVFRPGAAGAEIPPLPEDIKAQLPERSSKVVDPCSLQDALLAVREGSQTRDDYLLNRYIERYENRVARGESRHDAALKTFCNLYRDVLKDRAGAGEFEAIRDHVFDSLTSPAGVSAAGEERKPYEESWARADIERCISWSYAQALADWHTEVEAGASEAISPASSFSTSRWRIMSEDDLETLEFPPDLVHESLPSVGIGQLYGDTMAGKTFVALDLGYRITRGLPWFGREVESPGDVVYVYKEGAKSVQGRARAWRREYGATPKDAPGRFIFVPGDGLFSDEKDVRALEKMLAEAGVRPKLILGDTQALLLATQDENDNAEAAAHTRLLKAWSERMGCLVLLLHHTVKSGEVGNGARGAGGWKGQSDSLVTCVRDPETNARRVHVKKYKDGAEWSSAEGFSIKQIPHRPSTEAVLVPTGAVNLGEMSKQSEKAHARYLRAIQSAGAEATVSGVARELGVTTQAVSQTLSRLRRAGLVDKDDTGIHFLTESGEAEVSQ